jgi:hypothetical protein
VADFARGPGQRIELSGEGSGLPVRISDASGVRFVSFLLFYDTELLEISGALPGEDLRRDTEVVFRQPAPGVILVEVIHDEGVGNGAMDLIYLEATVPDDAPIGASHVLNLFNVRIEDELGVARADDGVHSVGYLGDATGDGSYGATDASLILRTSVELDDGFAAYRLTDPLIIADVNGNGILGTEDARAVLRESVGLDTELPEIPSAGQGGGAGLSASDLPSETARVEIRAGQDVRQGEKVATDIKVGYVSGLSAAEISLGFDPSALAVHEVRSGDALSGALLEYGVDETTGELRIAMASALPTSGGGVLVEVDFAVMEFAPAGESVLDLRHVLLDDGGIAVSPVPVKGYDPSDSTLTIIAVNKAPVLSLIQPMEVEVGDVVELRITASDPDGSASKLTYRLDAAPSGATIDAQSGLFQWKPGAEHGGYEHTITVTVSDNGTPVLRDSMTFTINVLDPKAWVYAIDWNLGLEEESPEEIENTKYSQQPVEEEIIAVTPKGEPLFASPFYDPYAYDDFYYY